MSISPPDALLRLAPTPRDRAEIVAALCEEIARQISSGSEISASLPEIIGRHNPAGLAILALRDALAPLAGWRVTGDSIPGEESPEEIRLEIPEQPDRSYWLGDWSLENALRDALGFDDLDARLASLLPPAEPMPHPDYVDPHDPFSGSCEEAALVLLHSFTAAPENNLVDLPSGWTIALDQFWGGPGWEIISPTGDRFVAIFEEAQP